MWAIFGTQVLGFQTFGFPAGGWPPHLMREMSYRQGQGVPGHQVLPIGGAQHTQTFCQLLRGFLPLQCASLLLQALRWGLGCDMLPAFDLPGPGQSSA